MKLEVILVILSGYCLLREAFFIYSTQKLMNKMMSRNYYDYLVSEKAGSLDEKGSQGQQALRVEVEESDVDTLNSLL